LSHDGALALLDENAPVEFLTFVFGIWAAAEALRMSWQLRSRGEYFAATFYVAFGALMLFLGMEEIGWGQQFLGFPTPAAWKPYNAQGETTLHNIKLIAKYLETLPLGYGVVALIGTYAAPRLRLPAATWPSRLLVSWFVVITAQSAIDLMHEFTIPSATLDTLINELDELSEMLVALSGVLYVRLNQQGIKTVRERPSAARIRAKTT